MTSEFHDFLGYNFWRVFAVWNHCAMCDENLFFIQFAGRRSHPKNDQGIRQTTDIREFYLPREHSNMTSDF
jgi:hypothetical protein